MGARQDRCDVDLRVRYAETDAFGYLHHAKYWEYFEVSRTELLRQNGVRYRDLEEEGFFFVVAKCDCRYLMPARYDDLLTVTTITERITRGRIDHRYEVRRDGDLICEAHTTLVCVGRDGKPIPMPDYL